MFDPLDTDSMFFQDEFIFRGENDDRDESCQECPDCGEMIHVTPNTTKVRCSNCGSVFRVTSL